jgi:hypothetical protein
LKIAEKMQGSGVAPPTDEVPILTKTASVAAPSPLRRGIALRLAELAALLLRAMAVLLLLSPVLLLLAWLFG